MFCFFATGLIYIDRSYIRAYYLTIARLLILIMNFSHSQFDQLCEEKSPFPHKKI
jgi:hypothetical protein